MGDQSELREQATDKPIEVARPTARPEAPPTAGPTGDRRRRLAVLIAAGLLAAVLVGGGLYGLFTYVSQARAVAAKSDLDRALADVSATFNAPEYLLQPIRTQEQRVAAATSGTPWGWDHASSEYTKLRAQAIAIGSMSPQRARTLAENDLAALTASVATLAKGKYVEASGYQSRLASAKGSSATAKTTKDYFTVDAYVRDQIASLAAFQPTLKRLQTFEALVQSGLTLTGNNSSGSSQENLMCAVGLSEQYWDDSYGTKVEQRRQPGTQPVELKWVEDDWSLFRAASSSRDYATLNNLVESQTAQVQANQAALLPSYTAYVLEMFKSDIQLMAKYGADTTKFQQQYERDMQMLAGTPSHDTYMGVIKQVQKQRGSVQLPLARAQAHADVKVLQHLIKQGQASKTHNPADDKDYPNAYEYADAATGIGDATDRLNVAQTTKDYQLVDQELQMFIHNLQAMLQNLKDKTPRDRAHQADLQLIQYYGVTSARVLVVSLREQVGRFYENGRLVRSYDLTTGSPDLPSVPGIHCALSKEPNTVFKSPWPKGSPHYYKDTPIHYGMRYSFYGYYVHDAWWRNQFGLYTNLPHYDPAAFNGGTHGCINFSLNDMRWVYNWLPYGAPIVVY
jgi:hypothetical protein